MNLLDLLGRGYLPRELPPPFTTAGFALHATTTTAPVGHVTPRSKNVITRCSIHNLARPGSLRRRLSIPNPIAYHQLADVVVPNWTTLLSLTTGSSISLTTPMSTTTSERAIVPTRDFEAWPAARASARAGKRYLLKADILNFYPSVYTHSIPWAIHGKALAKRSHSLTHIGNLLDSIVRNGQDQETVGIPIGPDTSLLLAEILLTAVDKSLPSQMFDGIRYVDDYEFGCNTYPEAEACLAALQENLAVAGLQLNPRKTSLTPLPLPLEASWTPDLRLYEIRSSPKGQATDLMSFFGKAFQLQPSCPDDSILKYAVSRSRSVTVHPDNWLLYEALLLQAATVEPGTLSVVVDQLVRYARAGYVLHAARVADTFNSIIETHGSIGHGSETAWALWGSIELQYKIGSTAAQRLSSSGDPVVALLALDARSRGLVDPALDSLLWEAAITQPELRGALWLLVYEAMNKRWLPIPRSGDPTLADPYFAWLRSGNVSFYEPTRVLAPAPLTGGFPAAAAGETPSGPSPDSPAGGRVVSGQGYP